MQKFATSAIEFGSVLPLYDDNPTRRFAIVTLLLILANVAVFVLVQQAGRSDSTQVRLVYERAAIPCELVQGRPLTLTEIRTETCVTGTAEGPRGTQNRAPFPDKSVYLAVFVSMFLHGSWLHLGGNMLFLWIFGNNVEDRLGPLRFLGFYLAGGAIATAVQVAFDPSSAVPLIGASGAVAAVMGAYLVWFPRARVMTLITFLVLPVPAVVLLGFWFLSQFFTAADSGVAWMAHVGGFIFGALLASLLRAPRDQRRPDPVWGLRPPGRW